MRTRLGVSVLLLVTGCLPFEEAFQAFEDAGAHFDAGLCPEAQQVCHSQCVDLSTAPADCGACGHDCGGGDCQSGRCQPVVLASNIVQAHGLVVDGDFVYFGTSEFCQAGGGPPACHSNVVARVGKRPGSPTQTLAKGLEAVQNVVVKDGYVWWTTWPIGTGQFASVNTSTKLPGPVFDQATRVLFAIAQVGDEFIVPDFDPVSTTFYALRSPALPANGPFANVRTFTHDAGGATQLASSDGYLYVTFQLTGDVVGLALDGGATRVIARGQQAPWGLAVEGDELYFTELGGRTLKRATLSDGGLQVLASGLFAPRAVTVDAEFVYVVEDAVGGSVRRYRRGPPDGGYEVLARDQLHPHLIAVDADFVYWTNLDEFDGAVVKLRKP